MLLNPYMNKYSKRQMKLLNRFHYFVITGVDYTKRKIKAIMPDGSKKTFSF